MKENKPIEYIGKAFISCSLREEDARFINGVENILRNYRLEPFGTVGKHSASPSNPVEHMRENIPKADIVVIVATPRYFQTDVSTGKKSKGLSEMVHVEAGMAFMAGKPVIAFVKDGTNIGNFLPNITQYVILNETSEDLRRKLKIITSLIENAWKLVTSKKSKVMTSKIFKGAVYGFAAYGAYKTFQSIFSSSED